MTPPHPSLLALAAAGLLWSFTTTAHAQTTPSAAAPAPGDSSQRTPPTPPAAAGALLRGDDATRELFVRATAAADRGDLRTARALYAEVWSHRPTYDVGMNLAEIEAYLGLDAPAATHAAAALALFPPSEDPEARQHLAELIGRLRPGVVEVVVEAPAGARVSVDGVPIGNAPLSASVFVDPGARRFEAATGDTTVVSVVQTELGATTSVSLRFEAPAAPVAGREHGQGGGKTERRGPVVPLVVAAGVTVIAAGFGAGFAVAASQARSDVERLDSGDNQRCSTTPSAADCTALADANERLGRRRDARDVSFVTAGVGLAATTVFAVWLTRTPTREARLAPRVELGPGAASVGFQGHF